MYIIVFLLIKQITAVLNITLDWDSSQCCTQIVYVCFFLEIVCYSISFIFPCNIKIILSREFPGGLVVRILGFHCRGLGSVPGWGTEIPQATQHSQKKKRKKKVLSIFTKYLAGILIGIVPNPFINLRTTDICTMLISKSWTLYDSPFI